MIKYPALVKQEAKNLKKFATKEELERLDFSRLHPDSPSNCVYGLCTGNCNSNRAIELIEKCASRVYHSVKEGENTTPGFCTKLNGSPKKMPKRGIFNYTYFSPIEVFIDRPKNMTNGANERLIKYLKGEIKRL